MLKNILLSLIICGIVLTAGKMLLAKEVSKDVKVNASVIIKNQEVGNTICPVSGGKIDEGTKATYEYQGKIYNLCCAGCIEEFKSNPEKYVKKVEEENKNNK